MTAHSLKILMTDPHLRGGGQVRYVANLAMAFRRQGHDVVIGCRPGSVLVDRAREAGARVCDRFQFRGGLHPRAWLRDIQVAQAFMRDERLDVLHVSGSQDHWILALANRLLGRPATLVRTRHNTYPVANNYPNRLLNRAWTDFQIVVCETVRCDLAQHPVFDAKRLCSVHNGVDAELFRPDPSARARIRGEFGFAEKDVVIGIVARLVEAKGHAFLFRALAPLAERYPQARALVLGQGVLEAQLKTLVQALGIADRVVFAGFRDDMAACVQAIDIGAQPSIDCDTSSFSLKEQMAAEKPVVASDYGGLTEIVTDGVEGFVTPAGEVEPLTNALEKLIRDPALRAKMGERGRARALREFTIEVFAERTAEAYRQAMERHRERTASR